MCRDGVSDKQLTAWLCAALIPTAVQAICSAGWVVTLVVSVLCTAAGFAVWKWGALPKNLPLSAIRYVLIVVLLTQLLQHSAKIWPGESTPAVPLILLALGAWSVGKGTSSAARVGCVLLWSVLAVYLTILIMGASKMDPQWLKPSAADIPWMGVVVLLIPCAAVQLCGKTGKRWQPGLLVPGAVCVVAAGITAGVISPAIAADTENAIYLMAKTVSIMGIAQRVEAVLSAAMTLGWFALICVLLALGGKCLENMQSRWGKNGVAATALVAGVGLLLKLHISWWIMGILAALFWVFVPLITQGLVGTKKS